MGSYEGEENESPIHTVRLDAFWIYQTEVTNAQYAGCVSEGQCDEPAGRFYEYWAFRNYPVVNVSWWDAHTYCRWAGGYLPTEAQWERAARGGLAGGVYPWGDRDPVCELGLENGAQYDNCTGELMEVASFAPNGFGAYDMAGNVVEWTADIFQADYYSVSPDENPTGPAEGTLRVIRGGGWKSEIWLLRVSARGFEFPTSTTESIGFRCILLSEGP
jgi:formylglycine-generating enzyme required for sulfatase activity